MTPVWITDVLILLIILVIAIHNYIRVRKIEKILREHDKRIGDLHPEVIERFIRYVDNLEKGKK